MTSKVMMIPPAIASGFGELGKHGSLINAEFGSSFRLSAVLTDAPFMPTPQRVFEVDSFCTNCRICENACPPEAISAVKQMVRGVEKWYVDFDRCLPFFNETHGCAICVAVCRGFGRNSNRAGGVLVCVAAFASKIPQVGMKIIFLDIDGVLNCEKTPNPRKFPYIVDKKLLVRFKGLLVDRV